jgi:hypothetical protein
VNATLPGTLRGDVQSSATERVGQVQIEKTNWFFLWGLVGEPPADFFAAELKQQVQAKGGDGVANLSYESQYGCVEMVVAGVTFGCVGPRAYKMTGDVVRIKMAPVPGKPTRSATHDVPDDQRVAQAF